MQWVDTSNPVNRYSPLNRGLVAWYAAVRPFAGRMVSWSDIAQRTPATISGGVTWGRSTSAGTATPLTFDAASFDSASSQYASCQLPTGLHGAVKATISFCLRIPHVGTSLLPIATGGTDDYWNYAGAGYAGLLRSARVDGIPITADQRDWTHFVVTTDGTNWIMYQNGTQIHSVAAEATVTATKLEIGRNGIGYFDSVHVNNLRVWTRALSVTEVWLEYQASLRGWPDELNRIETGRRKWVAAGGAGTFTAAVSCTIGATTASASATFAPGTKTFTVAVSIKGVTAAASGTTPDPVYTGAAAITLGAATCVVAGTFAPGTKTFTSAVTIGPVTASGNATFGAGTKTFTASCTIKGVTAAASATFAPGTKTFAAAVTIGPITAAASGTTPDPVYTGTSAVSIKGVTASGTAQFNTVVRSANVAAAIAPVTAAASGTTPDPVYTATVGVTIKAITVSGNATFGVTAISGTAALSTPPVVCAARELPATTTHRVTVHGFAIGPRRATIGGFAVGPGTVTIRMNSSIGG